LGSAERRSFLSEKALQRTALLFVRFDHQQSIEVLDVGFAICTSIESSAAYAGTVHIFGDMTPSSHEAPHRKPPPTSKPTEN
jgi:hypothetical protein